MLANPAARQIFRCAADSLAGTSLDHLIPERFRKRHRAHGRKFAGKVEATGRPGGGTSVEISLPLDEDMRASQ